MMKYKYQSLVCATLAGLLIGISFLSVIPAQPTYATAQLTVTSTFNTSRLLKKGSSEGSAPQKGRSPSGRGLGVSPRYKISPLQWKAPSWSGRGSGGWLKWFFITLLGQE